MAFKRRLPLKANLFTFVGLLVIGVIVLVITPCLRAIQTTSSSSSDSSSTVTSEITSQASNQYHVYYDLNEYHSLENSPPQLITEGEKTNSPIIDRMWYSIMD